MRQTAASTIRDKYKDKKGASGAGALRRDFAEQAVHEAYQKQLATILKGGERTLKSERDRSLPRAEIRSSPPDA